LQTHVPPAQACPARHVAHAAPPPPHAPVVFPVWQRPVASQQPPAHVAGPHGSQRFVVVLQRSPAPQSAFDEQPHAPDTHACPAVFVLQSTQAPPGAPQAVAVVPATH
jgi:hypothetical protein